MSDSNGHNLNGNGRRKPGPKPKIGEQQCAEILAIVKCGGSLADAADVIGVARDTVVRYLRDNPGFKARVDRAAAKGKLRLIRKVGSNKQPWQAAAWMLERKWGSEFGKSDKVSHEGGLEVRVVYVPAPGVNGNGRITHANGN